MCIVVHMTCRISQFQDSRFFVLETFIYEILKNSNSYVIYIFFEDTMLQI